MVARSDGGRASGVRSVEGFAHRALLGRLRILPFIVHPKPVGRALADLLFELARVRLGDPRIAIVRSFRTVVRWLGEHVEMDRVAPALDPPHGHVYDRRLE